MRHVRTLASGKVNFEGGKSRRRVCGVPQGSSLGPSRPSRPLERCLARYLLPATTCHDASVMDTKLRPLCNKSQGHCDTNFPSQPTSGTQHEGEGSVTPLLPHPLHHQRLFSSENHLKEDSAWEGDMPPYHNTSFVFMHRDQYPRRQTGKVECPREESTHALALHTTQDARGTPKRRPKAVSSCVGRRNGVEVLVASLLSVFLTVLLLLLPTQALADASKYMRLYFTSSLHPSFTSCLLPLFSHLFLSVWLSVCTAVLISPAVIVFVNGLSLVLLLL